MVRNVAELCMKGNSDRPIRQRRAPWKKVFAAGDRLKHRGTSMPEAILDDRGGNKDIGDAMAHPAQRQDRAPRHVEPIVPGNRSITQERDIVVVEKHSGSGKSGRLFDFPGPVAIQVSADQDIVARFERDVRGRLAS